MGAIKAEHSDKLQSLTRQLEKLKSEQTQQLKELSQLHGEITKNSSKQIEDAKFNHAKEMQALQENLQREFLRERGSLQETQEKAVRGLKAGFEEQMKNHGLASSKMIEEMLSADKVREQRENAQKHEFSHKEETLNHKLSTLSNNLRVARDSLAVSEKKVADLLSQFEDSEAGSAGVKRELRQYEDEIETTKSALRDARNELEISRMQYQQQAEEMKGMAGK